MIIINKKMFIIIKKRSREIMVFSWNFGIFVVSYFISYYSDYQVINFSYS